MQLSRELWLEGPYYIDYDRLGQLRIAGPGNHTFYGSTGLTREDIKVTKVISARGRVQLKCLLKEGITFLEDPAIGHTRKVREAVLHFRRGTRSFEQASHELSPTSISQIDGRNGSVLVFKRYFGRQYYGIQIELPPGVKAKRHNRKRGFKLSGVDGPLEVTLEPITNMDTYPKVTRIFGISPKLKDPMKKLWDRAGFEARHMIQLGETSGYDFGTVFPRDWMETADLGEGDMNIKAQAYMYSRSLEHVGRRGLGWHEDIVGEYAAEESKLLRQSRAEIEELVGQARAARHRIQELIVRAQDAFINRNMIDIEPHYLLGLDRLADHLNEEGLKRLRYVAGYIIRQARDNELITFKRIPDLLRRHSHDLMYYRAGNWRDSDDAFLKVHPVVAPFDVNAVFYPLALEAIARHHRLLKVSREEAELLAAKWRGNKDRFRFVNRDGESAFALALYDVRTVNDELYYHKLEVNHTDEAYDLFYGSPTEPDVVSFAHRLMNPKYFYTPSGPLIVGRSQGYDSTQYHGEVIWLKQSAFVVAGLARQLEIGKKQEWSKESLNLIRVCAKKIANSSIEACKNLDMIPELYVDKKGKPARFDLQPGVGWPMNPVQLWSAVGIRRIIREYLRLLDV